MRAWTIVPRRAAAPPPHPSPTLPTVRHCFWAYLVAMIRLLEGMNKRFEAWSCDKYALLESAYAHARRRNAYEFVREKSDMNMWFLISDNSF